MLKLPKTDYPELIQDELEVLLGIYEQHLGCDFEDMYNQKGILYPSVYLRGFSPLWTTMVHLFINGGMYKVRKVSDILDQSPISLQGSLSNALVEDFKNCVSCSMEDIPKYIKPGNPQEDFAKNKRGVTAEGMPSDMSIIAEWRFQIGQ